MKTVSIHDAKSNLSKYIAAAKNGEVIYIGNRGKPEVKLVVDKPLQKKRQIGALKGKLSKSDEAELLAYDKHNDPQWQKIVDEMYDKPLT